MDKRLKCNKTIKMLEGNLDGKISNISCNNVFADRSPWARETNKKM